MSVAGYGASLVKLTLLLLFFTDSFLVLIRGNGEENCCCLSPLVLDKSRRVVDQTGGLLSQDEFRHLLQNIQPDQNVLGSGNPTHKAVTHCQTNVETNANNCSLQDTQCPTLETIFLRHSWNDSLNFTQLPGAIQEIVLSLLDPQCKGHEEKISEENKPTTAEAWGYGICFVSLVCFISNVGALLTPFMSKTFFQRLLQFLVAMGAGALAATGLVVLIPEAFNIVAIEELANDYIWKSTTALVTIYLFFMSERFLKIFLKSKESSQMIPTEKMLVGGEERVSVSLSKNEEHEHSHLASLPQEGGKSKKGSVATLAWMVMIGDIVHNFVDGLAIGAAFTENIYTGLTIGVAVLCEELPHELSDIAILLHSGMSMKRALVVNFLSACVCYIGLILGIVLGENTEANRWILAIAGGLFLYVPLVDMLPDMSQHIDLKMKESIYQGGHPASREVKICLLMQAIGFILGISIIIAVASLTANIQIT